MLDYYTAPSEQIFNNIKEGCIKIWNYYDNTYGYRSEKLDRIKDITNIRDNALYMVGMLDSLNQQKLLTLLSKEARDRLEPFISSQR